MLRWGGFLRGSRRAAHRIYELEHNKNIATKEICLHADQGTHPVQHRYDPGDDVLWHHSPEGNILGIPFI